MAASGAAVLLAGGTKGRRFALPHSKIMIHQPYGQVGGQISDIEIQAKEIMDNKKDINEILAKHTGQPYEKVDQDTNRDLFMAPDEAKAYGIIDAVYTLPGDSLIAQAHDAGLAGGEGSSVPDADGDGLPGTATDR
jgi:ATP-dependent Clp protease protease subunit